MSGAAKEEATKKEVRRAFYLLDNTQSADLEQFRFALSGLAQLSCNDTEGEQFEAKIERTNLQALFETLEKRLRDILRDGHLDHVWLDRPAAETRQ